MLSQTARYALRATLYLAREWNGQPVPAEMIAAALGAPANYMAKTLHQLARAGIVAGVRGPSGGFRLLVDPSELTVARVVETFDEPQPEPTCMLGGRQCNPADPCRTHAQWSAVTGAMRAPLTQTAVADLLEDARQEWRDAS